MEFNRVVGLMSGTSLDGLDIALCQFKKHETGFSFEIQQAETIQYPAQIAQGLSRCHTWEALPFVDFHREYGHFLGQSVRHFLETNDLQADLVASHGHTIFHNPALGRNFQLGDAAALAVSSKLTTVADFRSQDICLGGQGAPLVPVGDDLLFGEYRYRLNLGGFSNISYRNEQGLQAYDVSPFNLVLNFLAARLGYAYDDKGSIASTGHVHPELLNRLNELPFYRLHGPKSLGREWLETSVFPLIEQAKVSIQDALCTFVEHAAIQTGRCLAGNSDDSVLITGGGAYNQYFIERLKAHTSVKIILPEDKLINFKEALVFAFLGFLRMNHLPNVYHSVTGAIQDSISGSVYQGITYSGI